MIFSLCSERSWERRQLLDSGALWSRPYRLQTQQAHECLYIASHPSASLHCSLSLPLSAFSGGLLYAIFKELFFSSSPNIIYGKALGKCRTHPEVSFLMIVLGRRCASLLKPMLSCFSVFRSHSLMHFDPGTVSYIHFSVVLSAPASSGLRHPSYKTILNQNVAKRVESWQRLHLGHYIVYRIQGILCGPQ